MNRFIKSIRNLTFRMENWGFKYNKNILSNFWFKCAIEWNDITLERCDISFSVSSCFRFVSLRKWEIFTVDNNFPFLFFSGNASWRIALQSRANSPTITDRDSPETISNFHLFFSVRTARILLGFQNTFPEIVQYLPLVRVYVRNISCDHS